MNASAATAKEDLATMQSETVISVRSLRHVYDNGVVALQDTTFDIARGDFIGLIGQNGSGKSTLAKHLNGLLKPTSGRVLVAGLDTSTTDLSEIAQHVGFVFQNPDHQIFCNTVEEELSFGPRNLGCGPTETRRRVEAALETFGLQQYAAHPPAILGFGLRRKVGLASILTMNPEVMVLDEPTVGLDWRSTQELMAVVARLNDTGHTIVLITHDMRVISEYTRRSIVLRGGRVVRDAPTLAVMSDFAMLRETQIEPPQVVRLSARLWGSRPENLTYTVQDFADRCIERGRGLAGRR